MFYSVQYKNGSLAASDLLDMFTQSIKIYYTCHYHVLRLQISKNVIHQIDSKNEWFLLSTSFAAKFGLVFVNTGKHFFLEVLFQSQQKEYRFF